PLRDASRRRAARVRELPRRVERGTAPVVVDRERRDAAVGAEPERSPRHRRAVPASDVSRERAPGDGEEAARVESRARAVVEDGQRGGGAVQPLVREETGRPARAASLCRRAARQRREEEKSPERAPPALHAKALLTDVFGSYRMLSRRGSRVEDCAT